MNLNPAALLALISDLYAQLLAGKQREAEKDAVIAELRGDGAASAAMGAVSPGHAIAHAKDRDPAKPTP